MVAAGAFFVTLVVCVCFTKEENSHDSKPSLRLGQYAIPLPKLEVLPSFKSWPINRFFDRVKAKLLQVCEL